MNVFTDQFLVQRPHTHDAFDRMFFPVFSVHDNYTLLYRPTIMMALLVRKSILKFSSYF